jgi:hypothetical protein
MIFLPRRTIFGSAIPTSSVAQKVRSDCCEGVRVAAFQGNSLASDGDPRLPLNRLAKKCDEGKTLRFQST